jgi:hypothetical protein
MRRALGAAFRAGERIDLVDLADHLRPRDLRGSTRLAFGFRAGPVHIGTLVLRAPRSARIAAVVAHHVLVVVRDVLAEELQPLDTRHDLEVALEGRV